VPGARAGSEEHGHAAARLLLPSCPSGATRWRDARARCAQLPAKVWGDVAKRGKKHLNSMEKG